MANELSSTSERFIEQQVATGVYRDRTDVIEAAISLLQQQKELLSQLDEGRRQLDEGDYVGFDREQLRVFFEGLKERARNAAELR